MTVVTLTFHREGTTMLSGGSISTKKGDEPALTDLEFTQFEYQAMLRELAVVLRALPADAAVKVLLQRDDRPGLLPYVLDKASVELFRTDPVAGIQAMSIESPSPAQVLDNIKKAARPPIPPPTLRVGNDTLADAFGESVAFRVRGHELECPGCGFWSAFMSPGMRNDPDRAGQNIKTAFVCKKKCKQRFLVSCHAQWGYVDVESLLETKLEAFYLPRGWNNRQAWVSRAVLQQKYDEYLKEKEAT